MNDDRLRETTIDRRVIHEGRYMTFRVDTVEDADGHRHTRDLVMHPGAVTILAVDGGDVLMVRQFRVPAGRVLLELPAGTLDRNADGSIEDPEVAAPRELGEETGFRAATWRLLGRFYSAPGFSSELVFLYLATDLSPIADYKGPEADERLDVLRIPWRHAVARAEAGEIEDAKSICGLFWLDRLVARGDVAP